MAEDCGGIRSIPGDFVTARNRDKKFAQNLLYSLLSIGKQKKVASKRHNIFGVVEFREPKTFVKD